MALHDAAGGRESSLNQAHYHDFSVKHFSCGRFAPHISPSLDSPVVIGFGSNSGLREIPQRLLAGPSCRATFRLKLAASGLTAVGRAAAKAEITTPRYRTAGLGPFADRRVLRRRKAIAAVSPTSIIFWQKSPLTT